ncbi:MAG: hypothetical protein AB1486_18630 [Planctomycetota bacterium]
MNSMKYGRRILAENSNGAQWCELTEEQVNQALQGNVALNARIFKECTQQAAEILGLQEPQDYAALAKNRHLKAEHRAITLALFERSGIAGLTALSEALDEKVHEHKTNGAA